MSRAGVIVIGSNSTRYVSRDEADPRDQAVRRRVETRLFLHTAGGALSPQDIADTAASVRGLAEGADAPVLGVYATSAVRDAVNAEALDAAIQAAVGLPLTVLSGPEEAAASFYGAAGDAPAGMIDIGGGSTEFAVGQGMEIRAAVSLQLGASRLFQLCPIHCAEDADRAVVLAKEVIATLPESILRHPGIDAFYSVGGTGTASAMLLRGGGELTASEGFVIHRQALRDMLRRVADTPRDQRALLPGFPPTRLDILPTGMAILTAAMELLDLSQITVTQRCNADGLLRAAARQNRP